MLVVTQKVVSKAEGRLVPVDPDDPLSHKGLVEQEAARACAARRPRHHRDPARLRVRQQRSRPLQRRARAGGAPSRWTATAPPVASATSCRPGSTSRSVVVERHLRPPVAQGADGRGHRSGRHRRGGRPAGHAGRAGPSDAGDRGGRGRRGGVGGRAGDGQVERLPVAVVRGSTPAGCAMRACASSIRDRRRTSSAEPARPTVGSQGMLGRWRPCGRARPPEHRSHRGRSRRDPPAPGDLGVVELIVRRPAVDEREVLEEGCSTSVGLVGHVDRAA